MDEKILLICTGGTMDAEPCENPKTPPTFVKTRKGKESLVMHTVECLGYKNVDRFNWAEGDEYRFVKDSKEFTPSDIAELARIIKKDEHRCFVITHGTDAIVKNARLLRHELEGSNKAVVFVGAIVPLSMHQKRGYTSDAIETLRFALDGIAEQPTGVYIAARYANTKLQKFFDPEQIKKDRPASIKDLSLMLRGR
jgi:L-asparaginase/Glu-tRNA(Gln) amidotransferase subunit D